MNACKCSQCQKYWSWKEASVQLLNGSEQMKCPKCKVRQYPLRRSYWLLSIVQVVPVYALTVKFALDLSWSLTLMLFGYLLLLSLLFKPMVLELGNKSSRRK